MYPVVNNNMIFNNNDNNNNIKSSDKFTRAIEEKETELRRNIPMVRAELKRLRSNRKERKTEWYC